MHWRASTLLLFEASAVSQNSSTPCKRCGDVAHGFASLNGGTTGGKGGPVVIATTHKHLLNFHHKPIFYIKLLRETCIGIIYIHECKNIIFFSNNLNFLNIIKLILFIIVIYIYSG